MESRLRQRPLVAVVYRVPLFVEALIAACDGIADVQALRADDAGLEGLLRALRPDGLIAETAEQPAYGLDVQVVHVNLEQRQVEVRRAGEWTPVDVDLAGEAIRNLALEPIFAGAVR